MCHPGTEAGAFPSGAGKTVLSGIISVVRPSGTDKICPRRVAEVE